MKQLFPKLSILTTIIIVLAAISITMLDFNNLNWTNNIKSYVGLIIVLILIIIKFSNKLK